MKILLYLNLFVEGLVGLIFVLNPQGASSFFANADPKTVYMMRMYGFAALSMSFLSLQVLLKSFEQEVLVTGLLVLAFFHTGILIAQLTFLEAVQVTGPPGVLHLISAIGFSYFYFKER
jgi:hypothetical protein